MKRLGPYLLLIVVLAAGTIFYIRAGIPSYVFENIFTKPCQNPIPYKLGTVDARFGLTQGQILENISNAEKLWEIGYGKPLFVYAPTDPKAMPINFIYDRRQQTITTGQDIDSVESAQKDARQAIEDAKAAYNTARNTYSDQVVQLNADSKAYADEVATANAHGGASPSEYSRLQTEKNSLQSRETDLKNKAATLDAQSASISAMIADYNSKVNDINKIVENFNTVAGGDFEEGQYVASASGRHIDIYAYKTHAELIHTLAHELGHALGLDHNQNPISIMYPYNKSGTTLSPDDLAALKAICSAR